MRHAKKSTGGSLWMRMNTSAPDDKAVISEARFDATRASQQSDDCVDLTRDGAHNSGAAMSEDGAAHVAGSAPIELRRDTGMPYQHWTAAPYERPQQHGTVPDVQVNVPKRSPGMIEGSHVRHIKETAVMRRDLEAHGRRIQGVLHRPGFDDESADHHRPAKRQLAPHPDGPPGDGLPRCRRRVHGRGCSSFQSAGMIGMAVRNEDRRRSQAVGAAEPILAAVNEHPTLPARQEHR